MEQFFLEFEANYTKQETGTKAASWVRMHWMRLCGAMWVISVFFPPQHPLLWKEDQDVLFGNLVGVKGWVSWPPFTCFCVLVALAVWDISDKPWARSSCYALTLRYEPANSPAERSSLPRNPHPRSQGRGTPHEKRNLPLDYESSRAEGHQIWRTFSQQFFQTRVVYKIAAFDANGKSRFS